jgi:adenosylcobinamide-GDP ribazoletransferase
VGAIVGAAGAGVFVLLRPTDIWVAAIGAMTLTIVLTGAFHEDGLADSADALGGSFDREKLFAILKDSRVGTYGALALVLSVSLRAASLVALDSAAPLALIFVHAAARTTPVWMMAGVPYVTSRDTSKSRPVVRTGWIHAAFATAFAFGLGCFFVLTGSLSVRTAARALAALKGQPVDLVWSSDLPRCHRPAEILARDLRVPLRVDPALREISMGQWEGRTWDDIARRESGEYQRWMKRWRTDAPPSGETLVAFELRVRNWIDGVRAEGPQLLIAHAGVVRVLRVVLAGLDWDAAMNRPVPHLALQPAGA